MNYIIYIVIQIIIYIRIFIIIRVFIKNLYCIYYYYFGKIINAYKCILNYLL